MARLISRTTVHFVGLLNLRLPNGRRQLQYLPVFSTQGGSIQQNLRPYGYFYHDLLAIGARQPTDTYGASWSGVRKIMFVPNNRRIPLEMLEVL